MDFFGPKNMCNLRALQVLAHVGLSVCVPPEGYKCPLCSPHEPPCLLLLHLLLDCLYLNSGLDSVGLLFSLAVVPTYRSSGPQGVSWLLWVHLSRIRMYSRNIFQGSFPTMLCILHLPQISIVAFLCRTFLGMLALYSLAPLPLQLILWYCLFIHGVVEWRFMPKLYYLFFGTGD